MALPAEPYYYQAFRTWDLILDRAIGSTPVEWFAEGDASFSTPLEVWDEAGTSLGTSVTSTAAGDVASYVLAVSRAVARAGDWTSPVASYSGIESAIESARAAAVAARSEAGVSAAAAQASAQAALDAAVGASDAAVDEGINRAIADGRLSGVASWADVQGFGDFPATFPPTTGTTSDTAFPGDGNMDGRYYTKTDFPTQVHATGTNFFIITGYDSARVHPKTGVALSASDFVEWRVYESDPDPVNGLDTDVRFDYPDPATQPALTLVGTAGTYSPVSSLSTRNITLPTGITTGDTVYIAAVCPGSTNTITTPTGYTLVTDQSSTGVHGYLFVKENAGAGDSAATVAIASSAALRVAAVAIALRGTPTSATVDGTSAGTPVSSGTTVTTGSRTSGTDTVELAVVFRTGAINGGLVTAPDGSWSKIGEAADASSNGGGAAVVVAHNGLTSTPASTGQGGDSWTWTGATGAQALTAAVKAV